MEIEEGNEMTTVTEDTRMSLIGLFTLRDQHLRALETIEHTVAGLVGQKGENGYFDWVSDAVWTHGNPRQDADQLLGRYELEVYTGPTSDPGSEED